MSHDDPFSSSFNKKGCIWVWICVRSFWVQEKNRIENLPAQHQLQFQNRKYLVLLFIVQPFEISLEEVKLLKYTSESLYTRFSLFLFLWLKKKVFPGGRLIVFVRRMWRDGHHTASILLPFVFQRPNPKKKYGVWDPMSEMTITITFHSHLCPLQSRLQHTYHGKPYARVDRNPLTKSTFFLFPSQELWIWPQIGSVLKASDWRICRSKKVVNNFAN